MSVTYFQHDHEIPRNYMQFLCAPGIQLKSTDLTCLEKHTLLAIANHFNIQVSQRMKKNTIYLKILQQINCLQEKHLKNKEYIVKNQYKLFRCLQNNIILSDNKQLVDHINQHLRPLRPQSWTQDPYTWLSNIDIYNVLAQYRNQYKNFKFLGVFPINFDIKHEYTQKCIYKTSCQLNKQILQNTQCNQFGAVFNLSYYHQKGSHWVALFICVVDHDSPQQQILAFYYDSCVGKMKKYVLKFIQQICDFDNPKKIFLYQNKKIHQKKDTECGMFCIHFLVNLQKISHESRTVYEIEQKYNQFIGQQDLNDNYVFSLRNYYFNK